MMPMNHVAILLVEDNPDHALILEERLRETNLSHQLTHAATVAEALFHLEQAAFDVILLDLALPDSVGVETVKSIYQRAEDTPIVVMTGNVNDQVAVAAVEAGAQDILTKAESEGRAIVRCIRHAIERKNRGIAERKHERLEEAIAAMGQVLGVVAHELRTPIASIRALAELLMSGGLTVEQRREEFTCSILDEAVRMADLVDNLLEAARINSGVAKWRWNVVNLGQVVEEATATVNPLLRDADIELRIHPPDDGACMQGDHDAVRRLIVNLLTNAIKNTHQGHVLLVVSTADDPTGNWVSVRVEDTGDGIDPGLIEQLGQPFAFNSGMVGAHHVRGSGLGLAICKGIIAAHGGTLNIESTLGRGATFVIRLRRDLSAPLPVQSNNLTPTKAA